MVTENARAGWDRHIRGRFHGNADGARIARGVWHRKSYRLGCARERQHGDRDVLVSFDHPNFEDSAQVGAQICGVDTSHNIAWTPLKSDVTSAKR